MSRRDGDRRLAAVLFTDIVSSTEVASELGDARWRELLSRHHRIVRANLKRFHGREQDTAGDGFFATFDVPADAVRCAAAAQRDVRELGIEIRAGVTFGEVEMVDGKPGGLVVHTGARIMGASSAGVVTVSSSVKELLPGAGIGFEDAGMHHLKGLDEEAHLYRVAMIDDRPVAPPVRDEVAARERRDRIVAPGPRRRRTGVVAAVVGVLVISGVLAFSASRGGSVPTAAPTGPPSNSLVPLDPMTGDPGQAIPIDVQPQTPFYPKGAAGEGGVWLGRDVNLLHVDPEHDEVEAVNLDTTGALNVDTGFGRVWVTVYGVSTVNVGTNEVHAYTGADRGGGIGSGFVGIESDLVAAEGAVWVTVTDGRLMRIDPNDPEATRLTRSPTGELDGLDVGADGVWTFDTYDGSIIRFDPETLKPDEPITPGGGVDEIALAGGSVWVLDRSAGTVSPLGSSNSTQVGEHPTVMSAGFDDLWVGDQDGTVYRVDPLTGASEVLYRAGGPVNALIPDPDAETLWVDVGTPEG